MHLQNIHEQYPEDLVKVVYAITRAGALTRANDFPIVESILNATYTFLDDEQDRLSSLYGLNRSRSVAKNLIINRQGKIVLCEEFSSLEKMTGILDGLVGREKNLDLSTVESTIKALTSGKPHTRWRAARALAMIGDKDAVKPLATALTDSAGSVRECAAKALGSLSSKQAETGLIKALNDSSEAVRLACINALGETGGKKAVTPLLARLSSASVREREHTAKALGKIGDKQAAAKLRQAVLKDRSRHVRFEALKALGCIAPQQAIPDLVSLLTDKIYQYEAAKALIAMDDIKAIEKAWEKHQAKMENGMARVDPSVYYLLGNIFKAAKAYKKSIAYYEKFPHPSTMINDAMGDCYLAMGMKDEALAEYDKSVASLKRSVAAGTKSASVYNNLAWFYVQKKIRPEEAVSLAEKAVSLSPGTDFILDTLGWAYLRNGQFDKCLAAFEKALSLDPALDSSWEGVSEFINAGGSRKSLLAFFLTLENNNPQNMAIKSNIARITKQLDQP